MGNLNLLRNLFILTFLCTFYVVSANKTVSISNSYLEVEISTFGAELQSIRDKNGTEYLWQGDPEYWGGRAPNMFPVCVKFKDQKFTYKGKEYHMPDMGLAKISNFDVTEKQNDRVVFQLKSSEETLKNYPFPFVLKIIYELKGNRLINKFEVENTGDETMYYAIGGHPGFRFPFESERYKNQLVFSKKFNLNRTEIAGGLVQENKIPWLKYENALPLNDARIPNAGMFVTEMPSRTIGVGVVGQPAFIEVELEDFSNVNIWSPPGMPYACIEPMVGHHDFQGIIRNVFIEITK
jgi:galactose mutarotase-like enzyme